MSRILPYLKYWSRRLGWSAALGLGLFAAVGVFFLVAIWPAHHHLQELKHGVAEMREGMGKRDKRWMPEAPQAALNTFYRFIPAEAQSADVLGKIYDAAYENELDLVKGEYRLTREQDARFAQYQVTLPVKGNYANIRKCVIQVLNQVPSAALDEIAFKRDNARSSEVEAKIRFTIFLGRPA